MRTCIGAFWIMGKGLYTVPQTDYNKYIDTAFGVTLK